MTPILAFFLCAVALLFGIIVGAIVGHRHGRDAGWVEHYFYLVDRERERRDSKGRFKAQGASNT